MIASDVPVIVFTFIASVAIAWFVLYPLFAGGQSDDDSPK